MNTKSTRSLIEIMEDNHAKEIAIVYGEAKNEAELKSNLANYKRSMNLIRSLMLGESLDYIFPGFKAPSMKEALMANDFQLLFPRVVQQMMGAPREPRYLGQTVLSQTIPVSGSRVIEFPIFSSIRAFGPLADGIDYPEQLISFANSNMEIRTQRYGLKLAMPTHVIEESQWPILGMHITEANNALNRLREEQIFKLYEDNSFVRFDNSDASSAFHTTGAGSDGTTANATISHLDIQDMYAVLVSNDHMPTHLIVHPMSWLVLARDPILRYQRLESGAIGSNLMAPLTADLDGRPAPQPRPEEVPFGLSLIISGFQTMEFGKTLATGITGSGNYGSITMVDSNHGSILNLQRKPIGLAQWDDPVRDINMIRISEEYGLGIQDGGRGSVIAKNVKVAVNDAPVYTVKTVTP